MEYVPNGPIFDYINKAFAGKCPEEWNITNKFITILGISLGMRYSHSINMVYRNLNPGNILLDANFYPKICGFHSFIPFSDSEKLKQSFGNLKFCAPEISSKEGYNGKKSDVFSFGLLLYSIIYDSLPFYDENNSYNFYDVNQKISKGERPILKDENDFKFVNSLIIRCWDLNPENRPTFDEITNILIQEMNKFPRSNEINEEKVKAFIEYCQNIID